MLTPATLDLTVAIAVDVSRETRVGLFGVSAGASLALLAAADPALADRVTVVVALAPWADLDAIVRLATTDSYDGAHRDTTPLVRQFVAASLAAALAPGRDRRAVEALLANRDPGRYEELNAALPVGVRDAFARLSPLRVAARLEVPVELASAADDGYFPPAETRALATAAPNARLTITSLLDHVRLRPTAGDIRDALRFWRFIARSFAAVVDSHHGGASMKNKAAQPIKFLTVGAVGFGVNLLVFAALYRAGAAYIAASIAAYLVANALMYLGNRYFTFRLGNDGFWPAYARYMTVGLLVAGLTAALLAALVEGAGIDARLGQAIALLLATPVAFVLFKRWTFQLRPA
jgi:putative flippase GtrA/dienelactone hydrolase